MTRSNVVPINQAIANKTRYHRWTTSAHDPVLQDIVDMIVASGMSVGDIIERVLDAHGPHLAYATIDNWLTGKTRRPQNFTVTWVAFALGYERRFVKVKP